MAESPAITRWRAAGRLARSLAKAERFQDAIEVLRREAAERTSDDWDEIMAHASFERWLETPLARAVAAEYDEREAYRAAASKRAAGAAKGSRAAEAYNSAKAAANRRVVVRAAQSGMCKRETARVHGLDVKTVRKYWPSKK